jgi:hypothetical protein
MVCIFVSTKTDNTPVSFYSMQVTPQLFPSASELRSGQLVRLTDGRKGELIFQTADKNIWLFYDHAYLADTEEIESEQVESILKCYRVDHKYASSILIACTIDARTLFAYLAGYDPTGEYPTLEESGDLEDAIYEALSRAMSWCGHNQFGWDVCSKDVLDYIAGEEYMANQHAEAINKEENDNLMAYWTQPLL